LLAAAAAYAQPDALRSARDLLRAGQPRSALELLQPLRTQYAGNAEYHYFLGVATLDAGDPDAAIPELAESLRLDPGLLQARAELGRAYLLRGDYLSAHLEFERVKAARPPAEVLRGIDVYVERVHDFTAAQRRRFRGSASIGFGHDSNVNSATSAQQITLPILGGIVATLDPTGRARSDTFTALGVEASGYVPLTADLEAFGAGGAQAKINTEIDQFDYLTANLAAGARYTFGANQALLAGSFDSIDLDHKRVRDAYGLNAEWRRIIHPLAEVSVFAQLSRLDYPREPFRDAERQVLGVAVIPAAFGKRMPHLPPAASLYWGRERPDDSTVPHLGHRLAGARVTGFFVLSSRTALFAGASYERRDYGGLDPLFLVTRLDKQFDLSAGVFYSISRDWTLAPALSYTQNRSNLDVFTYDRTAVVLTARYAF
jgi:tetratricopeptide (TPR) repeat protein